MNAQRLQKIAASQKYPILPIRQGMQLEIHEEIGEGDNKRTWRFKGLVIKVQNPNQASGTFTIRGKSSGNTIEKIYPLSFPKFQKVLLLDEYKTARAKLYYIRDKVGKDAQMKSILTQDERGIDLLQIALGALPQEVIAEETPVVEQQEAQEEQQAQQQEQAQEQAQEEQQQEEQSEQK